MKATRNYTGLHVTRKYPKKKRIDETYSADYVHHGIRKTAASGAGMLARAKSGAVYHCEVCEIEGMTLAELRAHWKETHKDSVLTLAITVIE